MKKGIHKRDLPFTRQDIVPLEKDQMRNHLISVLLNFSLAFLLLRQNIK